MDEPEQSSSNPASSVPKRANNESALRTHNTEIKKRIRRSIMLRIGDIGKTAVS